MDISIKKPLAITSCRIQGEKLIELLVKKMFYTAVSIQFRPKQTTLSEKNLNGIFFPYLPIDWSIYTVMIHIHNFLMSL